MEIGTEMNESTLVMITACACCGILLIQIVAGYFLTRIPDEDKKIYEKLTKSSGDEYYLSLRPQQTQAQIDEYNAKPDGQDCDYCHTLRMTGHIKLTMPGYFEPDGKYTCHMCARYRKVMKMLTEPAPPALPHPATDESSCDPTRNPCP